MPYDLNFSGLSSCSKLSSTLINSSFYYGLLSTSIELASFLACFTIFILFGNCSFYKCIRAFLSYFGRSNIRIPREGSSRSRLTLSVEPNCY